MSYADHHPRFEYGVPHRRRTRVSIGIAHLTHCHRYDVEFIVRKVDLGADTQIEQVGSQVLQRHASIHHRGFFASAVSTARWLRALPWQDLSALSSEY